MSANKGNFNNYGISRRRFIRQSSILGAATASAFMFPFSSYYSMPDGFPVVETVYGKVRGMNVSGTMTFNKECRVENDPTSELRLLWEKI
jgi:hypothetical protein